MDCKKKKNQLCVAKKRKGWKTMDLIYGTNFSSDEETPSPSQHGSSYPQSMAD